MTGDQAERHPAQTRTPRQANLASSLLCGEPAALAAGPPTERWLAGYHCLSESTAAGATWSDVTGINHDG
jgi:hypothetical protein